MLSCCLLFYRHKRSKKREGWSWVSHLIKCAEITSLICYFVPPLSVPPEAFISTLLSSFFSCHIYWDISLIKMLSSKDKTTVCFVQGNKMSTGEKNIILLPPLIPYYLVRKKYLYLYCMYYAHKTNNVAAPSFFIFCSTILFSLSSGYKIFYFDVWRM